MNVKNHNIVLKDTSPGELARFRQIMLDIWRQQIEDDKNSAEMLQYVKKLHTTPTASFISINEVIASIKKNLTKLYPKISFAEFIGCEQMSTPEKAGDLPYLDSQGAPKTGGVLLEWNTFNGLNLFPGTFQVKTETGKFHSNFSLLIFDHQLKEIAFKFTVQDFDLFLALFEALGIKYNEIGNKKLIELYLKKIKEAQNNPDKLDVIYESLPRTLFGQMYDDELYAHLDLILSNISNLEALVITTLDTNEDKAVLQILYAIKNRAVLYQKLRDTDLLYRIYATLHGEEVQDLLRFLTRLVGDFDKTTPTDIVYFDNSYYLFRDTHLKTNWSAGKIWINNYKDQTKIVGKPRAPYNPRELDKMYPPGVEEIYLPKYYMLNKPFNPLAKLNFGTKLGDLGEQIGDENTFVIALKLHNMATKQSNWDLFNIATDLLSLLSAYGALRIVLVKGVPMAARALAGAVLAKDVTHYAMLSNNTLEKWHQNGYAWLANLWIGFSVTVDLASFGLPNLSKIAKEGNAAAALAETAEEAKEIRRVANEANELVEIETGKDVSKMSEKEFEKFTKQLVLNNRKTIILADINQLGSANKIELLDETGENVAYITRNMQYGAKKGITYNFNAIKEAGTIKKGSKIDLKCEVKLLDSESAKKLRLNVKEGEEILYSDFNIPSKINEQYSGLGKIVFDDAHTFMKNSKKVPEINGMFGVWLKHPEYYVHYGGESINLKKFWKAVDSGMNEEKAAFETITGKWAKENGYTKVVFFEKNKQEVIIKFLKE